jgi:hypothetical protein
MNEKTKQFIIKYKRWVIITACVLVLALVGLTVGLIISAVKKKTPIDIPPSAVVPDKRAETDKSMISGGRSLYAIALSDDADENERFAAEELSEFFWRATGVRMGVMSDAGITFNAQARYFSIGETSLFKSSGLIADRGVLGESGFVVKTLGETVFLFGATSYGTLYACYEYLHTAVGFEVYAENEIYVEKLDKLNLYDCDILDVPSFQYRRPGYWRWVAWQPTFEKRIRILDDWVDFNNSYHTFFEYFPKEEYYSAHPDWYSADGKQLCLSQPGLREEAVKLIKQKLIDFPDGSMLMFGQEDNSSWCGCPLCAAENKKYGTDAAILVKFMNYISDEVTPWLAETQPGRKVYFMTFAYLLTESPPVTFDPETGEAAPIDAEVVCRDNVGIRYAPIFADFSVPFTHEDNAEYDRFVKGWGALTKNMAVWSYATNFTSNFLNFNNFNSLQENYQYFARQGTVLSMMDQGVTYDFHSPCFLDYRIYLMSKLMWNADDDVNRLTADFFNNYYRGAAKLMTKYFDEIRLRYAYIEAELGASGGIYADLEKSQFWPYGTLKQWQGYIGEALLAVEEYKTADPALYYRLEQRIARESLSVRYLLLTLYGSRYENGALYAERLAFKNDCARLAVTKLSEHTDIDSLFNLWGI